jgi:transposase
MRSSDKDKIEAILSDPDKLEMIIFYLLAGMEEMQIAKNLGVPVSFIRDITQSEQFNELWNDILTAIRQKIIDKLDKATDSAINRLLELMNSTDERIALEAVKTALKLKFGNFEGNKSAIVIGMPSISGGEPKILQSSNTKTITELIKEYREKRKLPPVDVFTEEKK